MGPAMKPENMNQPVGTHLPNAFLDCGSSVYSCMQTPFDMPAHARGINVSPNMLLAQNSNVGIQGMNGGMIKSECDYAGNSTFMFGADGNVLETHPAIEGATMSSFRSVESNLQPLNEAVLDADMSSSQFLGHIPQNFSHRAADMSLSQFLGQIPRNVSHRTADRSLSQFLGQIPQNFSVTDLTADFSSSSDILESYNGLPFRALDTDFLQPHGSGEQQVEAFRSTFRAMDTDLLQPHGRVEQQGEAFESPFRATDAVLLQPPW